MDDTLLEVRYGNSVIENFVLAHTPLDVVRELIQNEYDAEGPSLSVAFGSDRLEVRGQGMPINDEGWARLSVVVGTGAVGREDNIPPKANGIGSKNFGLRSLFLFGDQIFIASAGRRTVLDVVRGTYRRPVPDSDTAGEPGIRITVPYRQSPLGKLQPFTTEQEAASFESFAAAMGRTMIKLADPDARRSVRRVSITSARLEQTVEWEQRVRREAPRGPDRGLRLLIRSATLTRTTGSTSTREIVRELEVRRDVRLPRHMNAPDVPGYFRRPGGRIAVGVSVPLARRSIDATARGLLYYPLASPEGWTGLPFSVNAPFEMDQERRAPLPPGLSERNTWLLEGAAGVLVESLHELYPRFGADAYAALSGHVAGNASANHLLDNLRQRLRARECWPSDATGRRHAVFRRATALAAATAPSLDGFLDNPAHRLASSLAADASAAALARQSGVRRFTASSLVRLWCAGADHSSLATPLGNDEANFHYTSWPDPLREVELQLSLARALQARTADLTPSNREDLATKPVTLTLAGTLAPARTLWVVDDALSGVLPAERVLHPQLRDVRVVARECTKFKASDWARDTARVASAGAASPSDLRALADYLMTTPTFSRKTWAALRRAPILLDTRGDWAAPQDLMERSASGAGPLAAALRFVDPTWEPPAAVRNALKFRRSIDGSDFVVFGEAVQAGRASGDDLARVIRQHPRLLRPVTAQALAQLQWLPLEGGGVGAPADTFIRTARNMSALGASAAYAAAVLSPALLRRVGCQSEPTAEGILRYLARLRASGEPLPEPATVYDELAAAIRRDQTSRHDVASQHVLYVGGSWIRPIDAVLGAKWKRVFLDAVPVVADRRSRDALSIVGVPDEPTAGHWRRFVEWLDGTTMPGVPLPRRSADAVRRAYTLIGNNAASMPREHRWLLAADGRLASLADCESSRFLVDDDAALRRALEAATRAIMFADAPTVQQRLFFLDIGVKRLSSVSRASTPTFGPPAGWPKGVDPGRFLAQMHDDLVAEAAAELATELGNGTVADVRRLRARLSRIDEIVSVSRVERAYRVGAHRAVVPVPFAVADDKLAVRRPAGVAQMRGVVASALASLLDESAGDVRLEDPLFRLLSCRTVDEMQSFLEEKGISWRPADREAPLDVGDEEEAPTDDSDAVRAALAQKIAGGGRSSTPTRLPSPLAPPNAPPGESDRPPLPPLEEVEPVVVEGPGARTSGAAGGGAGQAGGPAWSPRSADQEEVDRALGRHGEQLALRAERERVEAAGLDPSAVVWVSDVVPAADHDILSIDDHGPLWVEVKTTTGRHGRFSWSRAEFELALEKRDRYVLYRVYEGASTAPTIRRLTDPAGAFLAGALSLDIDTLRADAFGI